MTMRNNPVHCVVLCCLLLFSTVALAFHPFVIDSNYRVCHRGDPIVAPTFAILKTNVVDNDDDDDDGVFVNAIGLTRSRAATAVPFFAKLADDDEATANENSSNNDYKIEPTFKAVNSLEEKMSKWEATDEEIKAATLGGVTPGGLGGRKGVDGFDLGLYVAFPFMILGSLLFAIFPLIMDKIDVSSVGPPPMV